jgi:hypothetical protein
MSRSHKQGLNVNFSVHCRDERVCVVTRHDLVVKSVYELDRAADAFNMIDVGEDQRIKVFYSGNRELIEKQRTPLATGDTRMSPQRFTQYALDASPIAGVDPMDLPRTIICAGDWSNFVVAKSSIAMAA